MERSHRSPNERYTRDALTKERFKLRNKIERIAGIPFALLGLAWLNLLIIFMMHGGEGFLQAISAIWILFQAELLTKIYLSPSAGLYFRKNPVMAASAIIPVLRILTLLKYISVISTSRKNHRSKLKQL